MSCLKWNCRLPGKQPEGRTPTHALTCSGCCLKHAGAPVTHSYSPAAAHRTPKHTGTGSPTTRGRENRISGKDRMDCTGDTMVMAFSQNLCLLSQVSWKKKKKVIKMLADASVGCQEQSWMWLLCTGHDCTSPTPFTKKACLLQWGESVWSFICFVFTIRH